MGPNQTYRADALAIRERKIQMVGSSELKVEGTRVYLDLEGPGGPRFLLPHRANYQLQLWN